MTHEAVINFWFHEIEPKAWWQKDEEFDQLIKERFSDIHQAATQCELYSWRKTDLGRLAEVIVLDQFSRNMYRNIALAFAHDSLALCLAQEAINVQADQSLTSIQKSFLYMPFMHSESLAIHEVAVKLFSQPGLENLEYELRHKAIIERFGRYPHRNQILERESTPEEIEFLKEPGSSF